MFSNFLVHLLIHLHPYPSFPRSFLFQSFSFFVSTPNSNFLSIFISSSVTPCSPHKINANFIYCLKAFGDAAWPPDLLKNSSPQMSTDAKHRCWPQMQRAAMMLREAGWSCQPSCIFMHSIKLRRAGLVFTPNVHNLSTLGPLLDHTWLCSITIACHGPCPQMSTNKARQTALKYTCNQND